MNNKLSPREWLKKERELRGFAGSSKIDKKWIKHLVSKVPAEDQRKTTNVWMSRLDKTIGEIQDEQMKEYLKHFEAILSKDEFETSRECYFGILPTRVFDAYTGKTPFGDRIIILHDALTHVIAIWCHWYTRSLEEGRNTLNTEQRKKMMLDYFVQIWNDVPDTNIKLDIYPSSKKEWQYSETLASACMHFVMAHELGHVLYGHHGYSENKCNNHLMEFQADEKGIDICLKMFFALTNAKNECAESYIVAPFLSLGIISLFGNESSITHPSATMRKDNLKKKLSTMLKIEENEKINLFIQPILTEAEQMFEIFSSYSSEVKGLMKNYEKADVSWLRG